MKVMVKVGDGQTEFFEGKEVSAGLATSSMDVLEISEDGKVIASFNYWRYWRFVD